MIIEAEKLTGVVTIEKFRDGRCVYRATQRNRMTAVGAALFASLRVASGTAPSHVAIGSGATSPADGDTALVSETARAAATRSSTGAISKWVATFNAGVATGTLREAGLFNASSGPSLSNRVVFAGPVVKLASEIVAITWTITGSNP